MPRRESLYIAVYRAKPADEVTVEVQPVTILVQGAGSTRAMEHSPARHRSMPRGQQPWLAGPGHRHVRRRIHADHHLAPRRRMVASLGVWIALFPLQHLLPENLEALG